MLKVTILQVQKTKEPAVKELALKYQKQLSSSIALTVIDVKSEQDLWAKVPEAGFVIALEVAGKEMASDELAQFIDKKKNQGISHLVFLIGPAEGFALKSDKRVDLDLSLSKMTFSHQTVRLLLMEQLYRAISILEGKPFAK